MNWLTDKEKRILFSALRREKKVCIEVDKQSKQKDSLTSVCESLEHKFYYDILFKQMENQIREETISDFVKIVHMHNWMMKGANVNSFIYGAIDTLIEELRKDYKL